MISKVPKNPKIYHIVHFDRLESILSDGFLYSDKIIHDKKSDNGTVIGLNNIKQRRLANKLSSCKDLNVGECVPFYFCPRSVMLYVIYRGNNPELAYSGGQENILHLEFDLHSVKKWAVDNNKRYAFTTSNAGSSYFDNYNKFELLDKIDWNAVMSEDWREPEIKDRKQAEFLIEDKLSWNLVERIGVYDERMYNIINSKLNKAKKNTKIAIMKQWYY